MACPRLTFIFSRHRRRAEKVSYCVMTIFMIIGAVKFVLFILNSLSKFGEVRYMRFALAAFEHL
jgi:hypothetical protein